MAEVIFEIAPLGTAANGTWHDLTPYIALEGLKDNYNAIDAAGSGRDTQDGLMHRHRVAEKMRWDVVCRPLTKQEKAMIFTWIHDESFLVRTEHPQTGEKAIFTVYSNNYSSTFKILDHGVERWGGLAIPFIEM